VVLGFGEGAELRKLIRGHCRRIISGVIVNNNHLKRPRKSVLTNGLQALAKQRRRIPVHNDDAESHGLSEFTVRNSPLFLRGWNPENGYLVSSIGCGLGRTPVEERKHDNTRTRNRPFGAGLYDRLCSPEAKGKKAFEIKE
jgi:hypothetical protein